MRHLFAGKPAPVFVLLIGLFVPERCSAPRSPRVESRVPAPSSSAAYSAGGSGPAQAAQAGERPAPPIPTASAAQPDSTERAERSAASPSAPPAASAPPARDALFESSVRPILASRCAPCHVPGGKMYARLPFDDASVVASHVPGISRRLKGEDLAALQAWIAARK